MMETGNKNFFLICGVVLSVMITFGLVGSVVSFVTWRTGKRCKNLPGATYLSALSLSDALILCTAGLKNVLQLLFGINLWDLNSVSCTIFHLTWHLFFLISTWIIVILTIDRTIDVTKPLQITRMTSQKTELVAVCIVFIASLFINLPFTLGARMLQTSSSTEVNSDDDTHMNTTCNDIFHGRAGSRNESTSNASESSAISPNMVCGPDPDSFYYKYENEYHNWFIDFGLLFSAPVIILTVCNVIILVTLCRRKRNPTLIGSSVNDGVSSSLTARVVILSVVQCVSVGPFSIVALIPGVLPDNQATDTVFFDRLLTVLVLVWYVNNCVNFILYSLFGKAFRRDCVDLFRKMFLRCRPVHSTFSALEQETISTSMSTLTRLVHFQPIVTRSEGQLDVYI